MSVNPTTPTPEDLIALSSYLDNELSVSERIELEQRLSTDDALRAEFESLRETVELVRSLPLLKAPRNFTLDPSVYGADSQPNNVTFLSRKTIWRIGAVASIAATFTLVFAIFVLGGANDASNDTSNSFDQSVGMANDNAAAPDENIVEPTLVAQTAAVALSTQVALSSTNEVVEDAQDGTSRSASATEIALEDDQSIKATSLAAPPTLTVASSPVPSAQAEEPSITTSGADESSDTDSPVATRTLIASFDGTQTPEGYIASTATQRVQNTTLPPNSGGANPQDGGQGVGGQADDRAEDTEESESGDALPPSGTFLSTPTPSPLSTQTSRPTASSTSSPTIQSIEASVPSDDADTALPEAASDAIDDTDTSTTLDSSDADESATEIFFDDANDEDAVETAMGEEDRDTEAINPPMPIPTYLSSIREVINFIINQLLDWLAHFSR